MPTKEKDKYLNKEGLKRYHEEILDLFAKQEEFEDLTNSVDDLESGKQNKLIAGENIILIDNPDNTTTISSTGGSGSHDYSDLINKPQINNVELEGNKSGEDLRLTLSVQEIEKILYLP